MNTSPSAGPLAQHRDVAILARLRQKDPVALGELYDAYGRSVFSLLLRIVKDRGIAEDLMQETFLRVWLRAGLFDSQSVSVGPWLFAIARNRAIDHLRSGMAIGSPDSERIAGREDPRLFGEMERDIMLSLGRLSLEGALEKLGANQRTAIGLAYFEGCTQSEIAKRMGHPLGTVKTWVRSALGVLREHLHAQTSNDFGIQPAYASTGSSAERTPSSGQ